MYHFFGGENATFVNTKNEIVLVEVNMKATRNKFVDDRFYFVPWYKSSILGAKLWLV